MSARCRRQRAWFGAFGLLLAAPVTARAAIPAAYMGKPFDPAIVGGAGIIPATVKAGPFSVPGRIDFVNYDMGGDGVGFHTDAHYTTKGGDGYRTDRPTATMCLTAQAKADVWYDTSAAQDGMFYPTTASDDFYVGSVHPNDWFNYTIDVKTTGMYTLTANFATGNGPPGGEGGDGQMELVISVNGTMMADWKATFPDFANKANFHNWKAYPKFATLTLEAGPQVLKFQAPFKHLNLDYVQLDLVGGNGDPAVGGAAGASGSAGASAGGSGGASSAGAGGSASGGATSNGGASQGTSGVTNAAGAPSAGASNTPGAAGHAGSATSAAAADDSSGCACRVLPSRSGSVGGAGALLLLGLFARARRRQPRVHLR
jgi:hypothetical protein